MTNDRKRQINNQMPIVCLTVVGKSNEPLFIYTEADESGTLQLHSIVHCSLDIVEERRGKRFLYIIHI